jgi:hypothetical protein
VKPPDPPPPPKGTLELKVEETAPFSGTTFRYTVTNKTGGVVTNVREVVLHKTAPNDNAKLAETVRRDLGPGEMRSEDIRIIGPPAVDVYVNISGTSAEKKAIFVERDWKREK